jgi:hypothetical protein
MIMRKTIPSIVAVGVVFLALGVLDVWRGVAPLFAEGHSRLAGDDMLVLAIGVAALIGGTFVLRGRNWARWLLAAWMALHVAISVGKPTAFVAHLAIFGFIAFLLFRPPASTHFGSS